MADFLKKAQEATKELADKVSEKGKEVKDHLTSEEFKKDIEDKKNAVTALLPPQLQQILEEKQRELSAAIDGFAEEKKSLLKKFADEKMSFIQSWILSKLENVIDHLLLLGCEITKDTMKDEYMPQCVKNMVNDAVESIWPDIIAEVKCYVLTGFLPQLDFDQGQPSTNPFGRLFAWWRYTLFPYDKSIWWQLRRPAWVLWTLLTLVPVYGIPQFCYVIILLTLDKSDEYMMMGYITQFKVLQFFSMGCVATFIGAIQFYVCVMQTTSDVRIQYNITSNTTTMMSALDSKCNEYGPRMLPWQLLTFLSQVILVWIAFACLSCSKQQGTYYHQLQRQQELEDKEKARISLFKNLMEREAALKKAEDIAPEMNQTAKNIIQSAENKHSGHHRLMGFLIYDIITFVICLSIGLWATFYNQLDRDADANSSKGFSNWKLRMTWFWVQCGYGMLSFPFLLLVLPVVNTLLTHAKPTAFNQYGVTVPYLGKTPVPPPPPEEKEEKSLMSWATKVSK